VVNAPRQPNGSESPPFRAGTRVDRSRGWSVIGNNKVEVYDLDLASYLSMRDLPLAESYRDEREFMFRFLDPDNRVEQLAIDFVNSESAKFASAVRRIKKITLSQPRKW